MNIKSLQELRDIIDQCDEKIVPLLIQRISYIKKAAEIKKNINEVRDEWRIHDVLNKVKKITQKYNKEDEEFIEKTYEYIVECSINIEYLEMKNKYPEKAHTPPHLPSSS